MDSQVTAHINRRTPSQSEIQNEPRVKPIPDFSRRPVSRGKFIYIGKEKYWIRGITYGVFRSPQGEGGFPASSLVEADFASMVKVGINTVRTYTVPPNWLLDCAQRHGLRLLVGLPWEQHVTFLDDPSLMRSIEAQICAGIKACKGHPAVLGFTLGNEIPSSIVRWHGRRRVERFIKRLYALGKAEDPKALFTYVNYPTTEYLQLQFLDLVCYNVYLESTEQLGVYLARLQNLSLECPLLLTEIGLDSKRHGEPAQARALADQIAVAFAAGCAGTFVFSWTDEWFRGGYEIEDWDFGLTTRQRHPKPALTTVCKAYDAVPFYQQGSYPIVSVVICSFNGACTIRDTLEGTTKLDYPNYEIIIIDDGSTDATAQIALQYEVRLVSTENRGLSNARNTGWQTARGEIVAYIDDDAYPDPHWLHYLVAIFRSTNHVGVGGPNLVPSGDGLIAECVANAPGGPIHVLSSDTEAEHIPGCNMAFRRSALEAVGGFDPRFRAAGDDVDLCWQLQDAGGSLGFHAAATVWHHQRNSVAMYWRQQLGYGKAEALLEHKWPHKYNTFGHLSWGGRLYGRGLTRSLRLGRARIYQGSWGRAPFQSLYEPAAGTLSSMPLMPEWYLLVLVLAGLSLLGWLWSPLLYVLPLLGMTIILPLAQAVLSAVKASFPSDVLSRYGWLKPRAITAFLHLMQPMARLTGRLRHGLTPWRNYGEQRLGFPVWKAFSLWDKDWQPSERRVEHIETVLQQLEAVVVRGGDYERMDLRIRGGPLGSVSLLVAIEEHDAGRQLVRIRQWPQATGVGLIIALIVSALTIGTYLDEAWPVFYLFMGMLLLILGRFTLECARATGTFSRALEILKGGEWRDK
ncbi:MAG: glycosyltransferase [Gammaproteobacteria bacterium]|nr:glycosyltransferase [Gammaproteobacteria bacterium]